MSKCEKCGRNYTQHLKDRPGHCFIGYVTWTEIDEAQRLYA